MCDMARGSAASIKFAVTHAHETYTDRYLLEVGQKRQRHHQSYYRYAVANWVEEVHVLMELEKGLISFKLKRTQTLIWKLVRSALDRFFCLCGASTKSWTTKNAFCFVTGASTRNYLRILRFSWGILYCV